MTNSNFKEIETYSFRTHPDLFLASPDDYTHPLMNDMERRDLVKVEQKMNDYRYMIQEPLIKRDKGQKLYTNSITVCGTPGTGKTFLTQNALEDLISKGVIDRYVYMKGKCTSYTLWKLLEANNEERVVIWFDDTNLYFDMTSLDILKGATETGKDTKRIVTYGSGGSPDMIVFKGYVISTTNLSFEAGLNEHQKAVRQRTFLTTNELTIDDIFVKSKSLIEKSLNEEIDDLEIRESIFNFYTEKVEKWYSSGAFKHSDIDFSVRFIMKVCDALEMYGERGFRFSKEVRMLERSHKSLLSS